MGFIKRRFWEKGASGGKRKGLTQGKKSRNNRACLEPLEPRILLSADLSYATSAGAHDLTLKMADIQGVETLQLINNADPNQATAVVASHAVADTSGVFITGSQGGAISF